MSEQTEEEKARAQISAEVFDEKPAGTPPEPGEPQLSAEPEPQEPAKQEPVDEWAGVNPALRARFEQLQAGYGELETVKGRLQQAERRVGALTNELSNAKKPPEPAKEPVEPESAKKFREDYPEISTPIEERIKAVRDEVLSKVPTIDEQSLAETIARTVKAEIAFDIAVDRVEEKHPGWQQTKESPEFKAWQTTAPADVPKAAFTALDAIKMLDKYVEYRKTQKTPAEIEAARLKRLEQAQRPEGRKLPAVKAESDMTEIELRAHIAAQVFK